jgi:hypothetical protein
VEEAKSENRFELLYAEWKKFAAASGLKEDLLLEIDASKTDWEFIIKIDALLETALKAVVKKCVRGDDKLIKVDKVDEFLEALPVSGRTSLIMLLKATGCPNDLIEAIECVRRLRNGFAHDIHQVDDRLIEVIKRRKDRSSLLKGLSSIANYKENDLIEMYEKDPNFLRFGILDATMRFLTLAYHVVLKS